MRFYGITMEGKFINENVAQAVVDTYTSSTDASRLVYNEDDGYLWWGDDVTGQWRRAGTGGGAGAGEIEDMFSDLLRTSFFMNCSWNEFTEGAAVDTLINASNTTASWAASITPPGLQDGTTGYSVATGEVVESTNVFDTFISLTGVDYCMPSVYWWDGTNDGSYDNIPTIYVTTQSSPSWPADWTEVGNNEVYRFTSSDAAQLRMRIVGTGSGYLLGWGILYNRDVTTSCLGQTSFITSTETISSPTSTVTVTYDPNNVLVFLNGVLLLNGDDCTTTSGTQVDFATQLAADDVVHVITVSG